MEYPVVLSIELSLEEMFILGMAMQLAHNHKNEMNEKEREVFKVLYDKMHLAAGNVQPSRVN